MCRIMGGIVNPNTSFDLEVLESMRHMLKHGGPDDYGIEIFNIHQDNSQAKNIGIAFDRLSIRDLSLAGHQPMFNHDRNVMIAFNGEIYNSEDYREELIGKGYAFKGHSDTEIILALFDEYGFEGMLERLDGMFGICLVDFKNQYIYLVRDRLGEKPLYYYQNDDVFLFASEYKAFYASPFFKAELNNDNVDEYLLFRSVSHNETLLKGVHNLPPGHYMEITASSRKIKQYWSIPDSNSNGKTLEENKIILKNLIIKSTKRRMISDVPIGMQLSGGVDSSYLSTIVKDYVNSLHTFSIIFDMPGTEGFSEEKWINIVNDKYGFIPHKYKFGSEEFLDTWKECTWYLEAPMYAESNLGLLYLNRKAKEYVSVMLAGEGADESFGGYVRYAELARLLDTKTTEELENHFIAGSQFLNNESFVQLRPQSGENAIKRVFEKRREIYLKNARGVRKFMDYDMRTYLVDLLMRGDKVSMASAMELRIPLLMPELVEFNATIPDDQLVNRNGATPSKRTKVILKSLSEEAFDDDFIYREKMGFPMPLILFWRNTEVKTYIEDIVLPGIKKRGLVNYDTVMRMWERVPYIDFKSPDRRTVKQGLWLTLSLEIWAQIYLDNRPQDWKHIDF